MKSFLKRKNVSLSTLTIIFIGIAVTAAVTICIGLFSAVYSRSLLRDAAVSSEQVVQQTTVAVNNYLDAMKDKLSKISDGISQSDSVEEFTENLSLTAQMQSDIYSITIYDKNGNILECVCETGQKKKEHFHDLSFDKDLFSSSEKYILSPPHVQTVFEGEYPWVVTLAQKQDHPMFSGEVYISIDFKF